jgi:hypothetical protein
VHREKYIGGPGKLKLSDLALVMIELCNGCRRFVRGLATLTPLSPPGLLVAEGEMLHIELIAQRQDSAGKETNRGA